MEITLKWLSSPPRVLQGWHSRASKDPEGKILHAFGKSSWVQQFVLKMQYYFAEALIQQKITSNKITPSRQRKKKKRQRGNVCLFLPYFLNWINLKHKVLLKKRPRHICMDLTRTLWAGRLGVAGQHESQEQGKREGRKQHWGEQKDCAEWQHPQDRFGVCILVPSLLPAVQDLAAPLLLNGIAASGDGGQQMHSELCLWR